MVDKNDKNIKSTGSKAKSDSPRVMILKNDEINDFDHVIQCLVEICDHNETQAEQCVLLAHYNGLCEIKTGTLSTLKTMKDQLTKRGLTINIQ
jgi:ATP-dependent Clp protease adaptor protein ClpS